MKQIQSSCEQSLPVDGFLCHELNDTPGKHQNPVPRMATSYFFEGGRKVVLAIEFIFGGGREGWTDGRVGFGVFIFVF